MHWDVIRVEVVDDHRLFVELQDGLKGIFDVRPLMGIGAFRELQDPSYFRQVRISFGALSWPNEQDIAPETLIAELKPCESASLTQL